MDNQKIISNGETFIKTSYHGISVVVDENGYFNASKICMDNKKRFKDWKKDKRSRELLQKYSNFLRKSIETGVGEFSHTELPLILNKNIGYNNETKGFYIHFKLVHDICNWCDLDYAIQVGEIMDMLNHENQMKNITLENTIKEMAERIEKLEIEINNKSVRINIDSRPLRIYDITDYEEGDKILDPLNRECIWWVSANNKKSNEYRLLLDVEVVSSMHARMDMKDYYNKHRLNGKQNTVNQFCKYGIYNYIMKHLKPKKVVEDKILI